MRYRYSRLYYSVSQQLSLVVDNENRHRKLSLSPIHETRNVHPCIADEYNEVNLSRLYISKVLHTKSKVIELTGHLALSWNIECCPAKTLVSDVREDLWFAANSIYLYPRKIRFIR